MSYVKIKYKRAVSRSRSLLGVHVAGWCMMIAWSLVFLGAGMVRGEAPMNPPPLAPSYRLGAEDVLKISVWKDESLTAEVAILTDGFVSFPLVGTIRAGGKTIDQFTDDLKKALAYFVSDPSVSVVVAEAKSLKIYVIGKVNRPGEFLVGHQTDVMQALSLAGGITPYASQSNIKILRRLDERQIVFPFDYGDVMKGNSLEQNIQLERWDVVMVP
jgi:polysaccharide biosynthesis/export protein